MTTEKILEKIIAIISDQMGIDAEGLSEETNIIDDLQADSLDIVELTMAVEDEFSLPEVSDEDLEGLKTIGDLVEYVSNIVQ